MITEVAMMASKELPPSPQVPTPLEPLEAPAAAPAPAEQAPTPSVAYVHFQGHINLGSTASLIAVLSHLESQGIPRVVLFLTTQGGVIEAGMNLYEKMLGFTFHLVTHAVAAVHSMGVAVFLAGDERFIGPAATLGLHPSAHRFQAGELLPASTLRQVIASLEASDEREASIIQERTSMSAEQAKALIEATTVLNAEQAVSAGMASEIKVPEVDPPNAPYYPLGDYPGPGE